MEKTNNARPFTIQINSLEALERLIGGSSELEIDIRNSIIQAFAEKHLKAVFNDSKFQEKLNHLTGIIEKQSQNIISEAFGKWKDSGGYYNTKTFELNKDIKEKVEYEAKNQSFKIIDNIVKEVVDKWITKDYIGERVKAYTDSNLEKTIKDAVNERLKQISANINK